MTSNLLIVKPRILEQALEYYTPATYQIELNPMQQSYLQRIYKDKDEINIGMNIQFLQSANMMNGNYVTLTAETHTSQILTWTVDLDGTFYSIAEFTTWFIPQITMNTQDTVINWVLDQNKLQNQGIFSLKLNQNYEGITDIKLEFFGYQTLSILGLNTIENPTQDYMSFNHLQAVDAFIEGYQICYMPLVKQLQVVSNLQKDLTMCSDGKLRPMIASLVNSVLQGDWASFQNNIDMQPIKINDLLNPFTVEFYDQNFIELPSINEMFITLQLQAPQQDGRGLYKGRILTNRGLTD